MTQAGGSASSAPKVPLAAPSPTAQPSRLPRPAHHRGPDRPDAFRRAARARSRDPPPPHRRRCGPLRRCRAWIRRERSGCERSSPTGSDGRLRRASSSHRATRTSPPTTTCNGSVACAIAARIRARGADRRRDVWCARGCRRARCGRREAVGGALIRAAARASTARQRRSAVRRKVSVCVSLLVSLEVRTSIFDDLNS